jgi:hypothetical protein
MPGKDVLHRCSECNEVVLVHNHQAKKVYKRRGQFAAFLKKKSFGYPLDMRLGGPQRCFGHDSGNKSLPSQQSNLAE